MFISPKRKLLIFYEIFRLVKSLIFFWIDLRPSTTPSERYFRPIILESSLLDNQESLKRNPLVQIPATYLLPNQYHPPQAPSSVLSTVSSSQGELSSAFTHVPSAKQTTLNTKKFSNNHILADQSSSSADSGVHSSYTQSPIIKHSFRKYVKNPIYQHSELIFNF